MKLAPESGFKAPRKLTMPTASPNELYTRILGVPKSVLKPDYYELLRIDRLTNDAKVIGDAISRQYEKLLHWQNADVEQDSIRAMMHELATASRILLDAPSKRQYDESLKQGRTVEEHVGLKESAGEEVGLKESAGEEVGLKESAGEEVGLKESAGEGVALKEFAGKGVASGEDNLVPRNEKTFGTDANRECKSLSRTKALSGLVTTLVVMIFGGIILAIGVSPNPNRPFENAQQTAPKAPNEAAPRVPNEAGPKAPNEAVPEDEPERNASESFSREYIVIEGTKHRLLAYRTAGKSLYVICNVSSENERVWTAMRAISLNEGRDWAWDRFAEYSDLFLCDSGAVYRLVGDGDNSNWWAKAPYGTVLNTRGINGKIYVEISLGSEDGLAMNQRLGVFRPAAAGQEGRDLGRIRLMQVEKHRSVGVVDAGSRFRKDDYVVKIPTVKK